MRPLALGLIKAYKVVLSPYIPGQCRYSPTCSEYAADAISAYGVARGTAMTAKRLVRCRPGAEGGYDPAVPDEEFNNHHLHVGDDGPVSPAAGQLEN